jgi:tripartite-type tricarboxylate transporter receptor subunit TctC
MDGKGIIMTLTRAMRACAAISMCLHLGLAAAQPGYPDRPIHMVVPYPPGGIADRIARDVSQGLGKRLDQAVIVENRAGAAGNIGFEWVARQPADGYTFILAPASNLTIQDALFKKLSYDVHKGFTPVSLLIQTPLVLVVNPGLPVHNVKELVEYANAHPGKVNFGVTLGAYPHLAGEMLKTRAHADLTAIPYQGLAPAMNDLLSGQTQFGFTDVPTSISLIQSGKLRPIAVAYRTRAPWLPDVPTMAEQGYPGFEVTSWYAVAARAGTPAAIVDRISKDIAAVVQDPEFRKRYDEIGAATVGSTPAELGTFISSESDRWTAVVKQAGIEPN